MDKGLCERFGRMTHDKINHWLTEAEQSALTHLMKMSAKNKEEHLPALILAGELAKTREILSKFEYRGDDLFGGSLFDACEKCAAKPSLGDKHSADCPFKILDEVRTARK